MTQTPSQQNTTRATSASFPVRPLNLWLDAASDREVRIEIIPLIDVIFCILTFFILAAVGFARQQAIGLDLPQASTGTPQMQEMLIVSLDYAGQVYVEQDAVADSQLYQALESRFTTSPNALLVLYAAKDVRYDRVVQVLDVLRQVGGNRVALATLPGGSQTPDFSPSSPLPGTPTPGFPTYPDNNSLDSFGAPPLPGVSPTLPGSPGQNPEQLTVPNIPGIELAPTDPQSPATAPQDTSPSPREQ